MVAGCGNNTIKYILLFLNFLVFIMALVGVIASLVFILDPGTLEKAGDIISEFGDLNKTLSAATIKAGLYVLLAASVIILIISFLGCCGAWKEVKFLLGLYAVILLIILIAEVAAFILALVFKSQAESELKKALEEVKTKNETIYADFEDTLTCCGIEDKDPCVKRAPTTGTTVAPPTIGCYNRVMELLKQFFTLVLVVSIITILIEIFLITFSCCLCTNIGENVA